MLPGRRAAPAIRNSDCRFRSEIRLRLRDRPICVAVGYIAGERNIHNSTCFYLDGARAQQLAVISAARETALRTLSASWPRVGTVPDKELDKLLQLTLDRDVPSVALQSAFVKRSRRAWLST